MLPLIESNNSYMNLVFGLVAFSVWYLIQFMERTTMSLEDDDTVLKCNNQLIQLSV